MDTMIGDMRKGKDRHLTPKMTLRLPPPYDWLLRLISEEEERTITAMVMRALRPEFKARGLWPLPDKVLREVVQRDFESVEEFRLFMAKHGLWPPPDAEGQDE